MLSILTVGCLSALSGRASAQTPAPEAPPFPPPAETAAAPAPSAASIDQRLDDLDQRIRIIDRKGELAQEAAAADRKTAATTTVDEKGLNVKSGDGNFRVAIHGLLQVDARRVFDDIALGNKDTFLVRRARPILEASWLGIVDMKLMPDFGNGSTQLMDAYIDIGPRPWLKLRAGKFKPPVGLERLQSD